MQPKEAVRFDLQGASAIFKKPDVNTTYFTYNNIHRIALLGMLGGIMGLKGYTHSDKAAVYPEFYEKLQGLGICVVPRASKGYFPKKIQVFNNSVGYASFEEGGNLVVKEQWLENPRWTIYIADTEGAAEEYERLKKLLLQGECVYTPYLGKNDHPTHISNCKVVELKRVEPGGNGKVHLGCLFPSDIGELDRFETWSGKELGFIFREKAPYRMKENHNFYEFREFTYTDYYLLTVDGLHKIFNDGERNMVFY